MRIRFLILALFCLWSVGLKAQLLANQRPSLKSPHNTVYTHLYYLQDEQYNPGLAAEAFPADLDSVQAVDLAVKLKQILDGKGLFVRMNRLPIDSNYVDSLTGNRIYTLFPRALPEVYVEQIDGRWFYAQETVDRIPELHRRVFPWGTDRILNWIPKSAERKLFGLRTWQYVGVLIVVFLSALLHFLLSRLIRFVLSRFRWLRSALQSDNRRDVINMARHGSLLLIAAFIKFLIPILQLPIRTAEMAHKALDIAQTVFVILILLSLINIVARRGRELTTRTDSKMDEQLLPIVVRILKILVIGIGFLQILHLLNVNVTALIAGISIGGLALALAAQDTVKNLIGSVLIFVDKPFQIGDYISGSNFEGTVEEVGFRTTRIRAIDTSIISIPNGALANLTLKNLGIRHYRLLALNLGILYNTPTSRIEQFVQGLRMIIEAHDHLLSDNYYVYLNKLEDSSITIMFRSYLDVADYQHELAVRQEVLLRILTLAEDLDVQFAYPSTSVYIEQMPKTN